jgi:MFS family permease
MIQLAANTICAILVRDRHKQTQSTHLAFDYRLFKRLEFCLILGWAFFSMLGYIVLLFSLPSYAISIGLTAKQGSMVGALLNLGQGIGRPLIGYFSDAVGRINMAATCTTFCALTLFFVWIFANSYAMLICFALLTGTVCGMFWATITPVGIEVVGMKHLQSALSIVWLVSVVPTTFAEPAALELRTSKQRNISMRSFSQHSCM